MCFPLPCLICIRQIAAMLKWLFFSSNHTVYKKNWANPCNIPHCFFWWALLKTVFPHSPSRKWVEQAGLETSCNMAILFQSQLAVLAWLAQLALSCDAHWYDFMLLLINFWNNIQNKCCQGSTCLLVRQAYWCQPTSYRLIDCNLVSADFHLEKMWYDLSWLLVPSAKPRWRRYRAAGECSQWDLRLINVVSVETLQI